MKKNRVIYGFILIILFWIMIMYNGWQTELLFKAALLIPALMGIVSFVAIRFLKVYFDEREEYCQKNDSIRKYIMVDNGGLFSIGRIELKVIIEDYFGNRETRNVLVNSEAKTIRNFGMDMTFNHYGIMSLTIKQLKVYDHFCLFCFKKKTDVDTMIYIFPDVEGDVKFRLRKNAAEDEEQETGTHRGENRGEILETDEYHEGDDIRNIHWKLSSKSDSLVVKHYSNAGDRQVHIHVDASVSEEYRYANCDRLLGVLHALAGTCVAEGVDYDITGYGQNGTFQTDVHHILRGIEIRKDDTWNFNHVIQQKENGGINIYLTAGKTEKEDMPDGMDYICLSGKEKKKEYILGRQTVIRLAEEDKVQQENDKFFLKPYNDKIRQHKKIQYAENNFAYVAFMSVVALIATHLAICSVYDVMFLYQDLHGPSVMVGMFVLLHFLVNAFGNDAEDSKKFGRIKNAIIFSGYIVIILLGGVSFIFDGISEVVETFGMEITVSEEDYGFLQYVSDDINWLIVLVAYAVTDVLYNFCQEFLLPVHLLIVLPLVCISMIVGYVPPSYVVFLSLIYFPVIFAVSSCLKYGKKKSRKYLSDDYPYTGSLAVKSGIFTAIISFVVIIAVFFNTIWGGYSRPEWMRKCKSNVNTVLNAESLDEGLRILAEMFGTVDVLTSGERGSLDDTKRVSYTGDIVLQVAAKSLNTSLDTSFYLKSFAGAEYTQDGWEIRADKELAEEEKYLAALMEGEKWSTYTWEYMDVWQKNYAEGTAAFRESIPYYYAVCQENGSYYMSTTKAKFYNMAVRSLLKNDTNIYKPYFSVTSTENVCGTDGYEYFSVKKEDQIARFQGYDVGAAANTGNNDNEYGKYPYRTEKAEMDELLMQLLEREKNYAEYVEEHFVEVPEQLQELKEKFGQVTTIYKGKQISLAKGDGQYRRLGYEPYIQYVRKYFEDQGFYYDLDVVRRNDRQDFILEFMDRKSGYCIHFASAAVMMFRSMGIPARYAEGYFVTEKDLVDHSDGRYEYEVRDSSAHAWVEIYEEGIGWVPVEVTPGTENFVVTKEELFTDIPQESKESGEKSSETETVTGESVQTTENKQQEMTTEQTNKEQEAEQADAAVSPEFRNMLRNFLLVCAVFAAFLLRYQLVSSRNIKKLENGHRADRIREIERQLKQSVKLFGIGIQGYESNEEKAEKLYLFQKQPAIELKEVREALELLDKCRYAPKESISRNDTDRLCRFVREYGTVLCTEGTFREKFVYKYIKCLYLKSK